MRVIYIIQDKVERGIQTQVVVVMFIVPRIVLLPTQAERMVGRHAYVDERVKFQHAESSAHKGAIRSMESNLFNVHQLRVQQQPSSMTCGITVLPVVFKRQ
ncbi:hypothetical protein SISNIDRAFT_457684 [Sistotremastrum niveocremeum HHB9708]|uniref:Uncharacterized protein n=2 Tax=Sistotremastraceae TaxID=3402574 RepID=A0A164RG15_9AGAM|nr:hypothetical protein SISNIDRAFT_457684 [Sistotremastrum niveocremeum HHB9708]KZT40649.1 hypothetical protein SISSUDRAFT_1043984 [Sistotremastrum suecicum HHB10207 ss-3]